MLFAYGSRYCASLNEGNRVDRATNRKERFAQYGYIRNSGILILQPDAVFLRILGHPTAMSDKNRNRQGSANSPTTTVGTPKNGVPVHEPEEMV